MSLLFKFSFILIISEDIELELDSVALLSISACDKVFSSQFFLDIEFWIFNSILFNYYIFEEILLCKDNDKDLNSVICSLMTLELFSSIFVFNIFLISFISWVISFCSRTRVFFLSFFL